MPTTRKRKSRIPTPEFSRQHWYHLLVGHSWFPAEAYGEPDRFDAVAAEAAWRAHRADLLAYWAQDPAVWKRTSRADFDTPEPGGPGTRPWVWWRFEAPEPRRILKWWHWDREGKVEIEGPSAIVSGDWRTYFGRYPSYIGCLGPEYETERAYLERLGLLRAELDGAVSVGHGGSNGQRG